MEEQYMSLITDYIDGTLTVDREREFRQYVDEGHIVMEEVEAMKQMQGVITLAERPEPTEAMSEGFYQMLAEAKGTERPDPSAGFLSQLSQAFFTTVFGRMAFGGLLLVVGVMAGMNFGGGSADSEIGMLTQQVAEMQETMMISMLKEESVTERLKGVQISNELPRSNTKVTDALFMTLNGDESTNVRIAALQVLEGYADDPVIREGLINSISQQESPLMQVALAELMVELQEKKSIDQFKQLLESENTPEEVKSTLEESIGKIM
ncbi:MAG: HEAT repeat domain-containing protein [Roseivirga sp.]|nr:HEAT repeat domain-containing protein [Roseivirga sp.]